MSIGTIVIIVIAMSMLILGLVLVRNIFSGATENVDILNDKVKAEITGLFAKEGTKIGIKLSSDKTAKIKQGTTGFGIGVGALTRSGGTVIEDRLQYKLELTNPGNRQCSGLTIKFHTFPDTYQDFSDAEADRAFVALLFDIEEGAGECTQRVKITTRDSEGELAFASFSVQIIQGGIFS